MCIATVHLFVKGHSSISLSHSYTYVRDSENIGKRGGFSSNAAVVELEEHGALDARPLV
jgi:hypothetical protein